MPAYPSATPRRCSPSESLGSYRIKGAALCVTWPLTSDLGVCKLIMLDLLAICGVALCFEEETSGGEKVSHLSQPAQLNTHEHCLGTIKEAPSMSLFTANAEKCELADLKCSFTWMQLWQAEPASPEPAECSLLAECSHL